MAQDNLAYVLAWIPIVAIAIVNGMVRGVWYEKSLGELRAHQISTVSAILILDVLLRQLSGFDTKPTMVKPSAGLLRRDTFQSLLDSFYQCLETSRRRFA